MKQNFSTKKRWERGNLYEGCRIGEYEKETEIKSKNGLRLRESYNNMKNIMILVVIAARLERRTAH